MAWYYLRTGLNAKDMFGEVAYVEIDEEGLSEEETHEKVSEEYPKFNSGTYVKSFSSLDWDLDSQSFEDKEDFLKALGKFDINLSNHAYTLQFDRVSTKEAKRKS